MTAAEGTRHPELWAPSDVLRAFGRTSSRTMHIWRQDPAFPEPVMHVMGGQLPLYDPAEVRAWHEARGRRGRR